MKLSIGPGALVAAAFIGPGTVTACTLAGASFGFALVWTLIFATVATMILQGMAARLGVAGRMGLGEAIMRSVDPTPLKYAAGALVLGAILVGNCAYEAGNLAGAALGLDALFGHSGVSATSGHTLVIAGIAGLALAIGRYRLLEGLLISLVLLMSVAFAASFVLVRPNLAALIAGFVPSVPPGGLLTAVALIGTTIVPYNLFLHAAASQRRWADGTPESVAEADADTRLSIGLGGLISLFILSTAAASLFGSGLAVTSAADMAIALEPIAGSSSATTLIGVGLAAAGLTSAITAPMATGYVVSEIVGRRSEDQTLLFRGTALTVLAAGVAAALSGVRPTELILFAQAANGLLLPIIAGVLLVAMNRKELLGTHTNSRTENFLGAGVVLVCLLLGLRLILRTVGIWP
ncbi:MAG: Nramp family divalent metal transporter [Pseudomonadota bacterium]